MSSRSTAAGRRPRGRALALGALLVTAALAAVPSAASAWTSVSMLGTIHVFDRTGADNAFVVTQSGPVVSIRDAGGDPLTGMVPSSCTVVGGDTLECSWGSASPPPVLGFALEGGDDSVDATGYDSAITVLASPGADMIIGGDAADRIDGGDGDDVIDGGGGGDSLEGGAGDDVVFGGDGNDALFGGADDDRLDGGLGGDSIIGREGHDIVDYSSRTRALVVTLNSGVYDGEIGENDRVNIDVEEVLGGSGDDEFHANGTVRTTLRGGAGNDRLYGGYGADLLDGGAGDDLLDGGGEADDLQCGADLDSYRTDGLDTVAGDCELLIP